MERLKHRRDFLAAAAGAKVSTAGFVLQERPRGSGGPVRVGFTVSKKVGGAVERNRVRRRLREIVRLSAARNLHDGSDYVVIGRRAALEMSFSRLSEDFAGAVSRLDKARRPAGRTSDRATDRTRPAPAGDQSTP
jgi:ribonuclease P protein component